MDYNKLGDCMLNKIKKEINNLSDSTLIEFNKKILQINENGYGKNEVLLGVRTPNINKLAKKYYQTLNYNDLTELLKDKIHEYKLFAIKVLLLKNQKETELAVKFYQENMKYLTNWDLIDASASKILGTFLEKQKDKEVLKYARQLSSNQSFWYRRISVVMLHYLILQGRINVCLEHYKSLIDDEESLIQKALGWMLREIGKQDKEKLILFLKNNNCSSICFLYSTEHLTKKEKEEIKNLKNK